jgi:thiamine-monophosphate kinase
MGALAQPLALRRSAALVGDDIYVTGTLGGAARALDWILARQALPKALRDCLERPTPRVAMGMALATLAHACIDVSDGLAGDLGHILAASGVGATVELNALPVSPYLHDLAAEDVWRHALAGGDDYELCFTASPERASQVLAAGQQLGVQVTRVGRVTALLSPTEIEAQSAVQSNASAIAWTLDGEPVKLALSGFDHFAR